VPNLLGAAIRYPDMYGQDLLIGYAGFNAGLDKYGTGLEISHVTACDGPVTILGSAFDRYWIITDWSKPLSHPEPSRLTETDSLRSTAQAQ
jgi:hypothetical protein